MSQRNACVALTLDLIDWIRAYEVHIIEQLGIEYRRGTLIRWNNGKRPFAPAERFAPAWRELSFHVAANFWRLFQAEASLNATEVVAECTVRTKLPIG
ncbi:hypothetical protein Mal15_04380 [Stieleria maiorica]|uniref:Uncharacterized protein n=1 Tax=Stieleria maiorica TaxID=2795974 RepID=A0A5B9M8L6_9BACT|nr:hypothetical protein [Stieleria maiorica]QEF96410.1 hypothetical protein Mal15_04380 [Stieleria maiorica]